jgi:hypothetical protein
MQGASAMTKLATIIFALSMGIAAIVSVQPTPAAAFTQIGEDMGKCTQNNFKDKMCACKDSACAQKHSDAPANQGKPKPVVQIQGVKSVGQTRATPNNPGNSSVTGKHLQK